MFRVARRAFIEPDVPAMERDALFNRYWLYLGHDSELPQPNDFGTRLESRRGFWFLNYEPKAVDLKTYLAGTAEILDLVADHSATSKIQKHKLRQQFANHRLPN